VNVIKAYIALLVSCYFLSGVVHAEGKMVASPWITGTYSSFTYHQEAGDLNGVEVRLILTRTGVKGVVQFAEGGAGNVALVDVTVTGNRIRFELPPGFQPEGVFEGVVTSKGLEGTFSYKGGAQEHLTLPRKQSYWDRHK
jgi:hypothetical protein